MPLDEAETLAAAGNVGPVSDALYAEVVQLRERLADLRFRLAEHERTQATGGPPPPETRGWANEAIVPAPETAHDQGLAVPDRYQRSDAHLRDRREDTT
jgi:hypothetical protein